MIRPDDETGKLAVILMLWWIKTSDTEVKKNTMTTSDETGGHQHYKGDEWHHIHHHHNLISSGGHQHHGGDEQERMLEESRPSARQREVRIWVSAWCKKPKKQNWKRCKIANANAKNDTSEWVLDAQMQICWCISLQIEVFDANKAFFIMQAITNAENTKR